jgi:penicillin-binding protein 2
VVVEHGGGGSKAAAPIARDVMVEALRRTEEAEQAVGREAKSVEAGRERAKAALGGGTDRDGGR